MVELTRTLHQWRRTARRLELGTIGRPDLAEQIRWALPGDPSVASSTPLTVRFPAEDAALIERLVPLVVRAALLPEESAAEAIAAAEAIIRGHQRGRNT
ncbi:MAG: hypothetical protein M3R02_10465 [Chloroflexota bacterium]|nr:hypothetical protein [Chloroflexota bacterium]